MVVNEEDLTNRLVLSKLMENNMKTYRAKKTLLQKNVQPHLPFVKADITHQN